VSQSSWWACCKSLLVCLAPATTSRRSKLRCFSRSTAEMILAIAIVAGLDMRSLQTVPEESNKDDWFGSPLIVRLSIIAALALTLFFVIELKSAAPLLKLRLLRERNFGFGTAANFLLGTALYGSVFVLPLYLSQLQGYNAEQIGEVLAWVGLPQLILIPLVPRLMKNIDVRWLTAIGFALFAASNLMMIDLDANFSGPQMFWPNIVRAIGQAVTLTPLSAVATALIAKEDAGSASALFNMMRNLGGAIGIAALQTFVTRREQFHSNVISAAASPLITPTHARLNKLTGYFLSHGATDSAYAKHEAVIAIGRRVRLESFLLAYGDAFFLLGAAMIVAVFVVFLLRKPNHLGAGGGH
jgi:DHA2 family multidrug resistance protein